MDVVKSFPVCRRIRCTGGHGRGPDLPGTCEDGRIRRPIDPPCNTDGTVVYYLVMCLAVPALITKIDGVMADAELAGNETRVNILFTPNVRVGDYVIMHAGYAISVMDSAEAEETFELLEEMAELDAEE